MESSVKDAPVQTRAQTNGAPSLGTESSPMRMLPITADPAPLGLAASGTRILGALVHELRRRGGGYGCAAICSGGGQGDAVIIQV